MPYPKIELHVHLEGTVSPARLLEMARRNDVALPADTAEGLARLYNYKDLRDFLEVWTMTTASLRREVDVREITVDYARQAATHGAVYIEGIFCPSGPASRGVDWDEMFTGFCDGAQQAREETGVVVNLTPDCARHEPIELAELTIRHAARYRDRGIVGIGLGGSEGTHPPDLFERPFQEARALGFASVPHAGEAAGPASVRGALDALGATRIRHGIRAIEDANQVAELAARGVVLDVCLLSNVFTRAVPSLEDHPLPKLIEAGVCCSLSTDDPAMFGTDLTMEYATASSLGVDPEALYWAGVRGALCDETTRTRLTEIGRAADWASHC
jgi:aminodeoxyfutalosine deaminase